MCENCANYKPKEQTITELLADYIITNINSSGGDYNDTDCEKKLTALGFTFSLDGKLNRADLWHTLHKIRHDYKLVKR